MDKNKQTISVIIVIILAVLLFRYNQQFSIYTPSPRTFYQYTSPLQDSNGVIGPEWNDVPKTASAIVIFNLSTNYNLKFVSEIKDQIPIKYCKNLNAQIKQHATSLINIYNDSDGCSHWSYYVPYIRAYWTCDSSSSCCGYAGGPETGYFTCSDPKKSFGCGTEPCYAPWVPGAWTPVQPEVLMQNESDFGGAFYSTIDPVTSLVNYGCYQNVSVYKNNQLVDVLLSTEEEDNTEEYIDYTSGFKIKFLKSSSRFLGVSCRYFQNNYLIEPSSNFMNILIFSVNRYKVGDPVNLTLKIYNNLSNSMVPCDLKIDYEASSILGSIKSSEYRNITLSPGETTVIIPISSDKVVSELKVTPSIIIKFSNSNIYGLNIVNSQGQITQTELVPDMPIATITGSPAIIQISNETIKLVNSTVYVNQTKEIQYVNQTVYVEKKVPVEPNMVDRYGVFFGILVVIIISLIFLIRGWKK